MILVQRASLNALSVQKKRVTVVLFCLLNLTINRLACVAEISNKKIVQYKKLYSIYQRFLFCSNE